MEAVKAIGIGVVVAAMLYCFYAAFRTLWPTSYASVRSEAEAHHRRGPLRFLLVRVLPVLIVAAAIGHVTTRLHLPTTAAEVTFALAHLLTTDAQVLARWRAIPPSRLVYHLASAALVALTTLTGAWAGPRAPWAFPDPSEFVKAIWTAALTAVLGGAYLKATATSRPHTSNLDWAITDIGPSLWDSIPAIAHQHDADEYLVKSIVAAEAMQRPRWFRTLERHNPWSTTHGVAQVHGPRHMTDQESIHTLSRSLAGYYPERTPYGTLRRRHEVECRLENHNSTPAFMNDVLDILTHVTPSVLFSYATSQTAYDNLPTMMVTGLTRTGAHVTIHGNIAHPHAHLSITTPRTDTHDELHPSTPDSSPTGSPTGSQAGSQAGSQTEPGAGSPTYDELTRIPLKNTPWRQPWTACVPITTRSVTITCHTTTTTRPHTLTLDVDLDQLGSTTPA